MKSPTPRDAGNKNPCVKTGVHTAFANPESPLVDASTIRGAEPERALRACQYLAMRYFGTWIPDCVGRAKHSTEPLSACAC
jgi:hypothetical protein